MQTKIIALSAAVLMATAPAVFAQGVSSKTPGQEMQKKSSKKGASGHQAQAKSSKKGTPGASSYAPGQTTGSNTKSKY